MRFSCEDLSGEYLENWEEHYSDFDCTLILETKDSIIRLDKSQIQSLKDFLETINV